MRELIRNLRQRHWTAIPRKQWSRFASSKRHVSAWSRRGALSMACAFFAQFGLAYAGELSVFEHNGSIIEWFVVGDTIKATYSMPRPGLAKSGVQRGATLFEGAYEGDRIVGKAFAFKGGCAPASYQVIGRHGDKQTVLDGPAPLRSGCSVTGYSATSPHARLVLIFSARHH